MKPPKPTTIHPTNEVAATARTADPSTQMPAGLLVKTRADFRVGEFRKLIQQKGYFFVWRKAILCACVNVETFQPRVDCRTCDMSGFFYIEPRFIQGTMTNLENQKNIYRNLGEWLEGSSMLTVEPEHRLGFKDSLEMRHSVMLFNEWIKKGNRHGVRSSLPVDHDVARYRIVRMLHMLCELDGQMVSLEEGIHFEITEQGWIKWLSRGKTIPNDTILSINYEFHPVWIVITHPHAIRDTVSKFKQPDFTVQSMPIQVTVKLDYLAETERVLNTSDVLFDRGTPREVTTE